MPIDPALEIPFTIDDVDPTVAPVRHVIARGRGWVNLAPEVEPGTEPPRRNLFASIFSSRGPVLPLATISPALDKRDAPDGSAQLALGLQHAGGTRALETLASMGHPMPDRWRKVSDHPRRGFVVSAPATEDPGELVRWLVGAAELLTQVELDDAWVARVYEG